MKEKLPSLLASKQGLLVACAFFNVLDAKDRKLVLKSLQEPLKEMLQNKVAHLFILHILNTLDDTVLAKKKLLQDILVHVDDLYQDPNYQNVLIGIYEPQAKRYFKKEDFDAFNALKEHSTSKKDPEQRRTELIKIIQGPLEKFYEEKIGMLLNDVGNHPLFTATLKGRVELGSIEESDLVDEFIRQVQKKCRQEESEET